MNTIRNAYAGRDVMNAPKIKTAIQQRSEQRGDAPDVSAWLLNHFYRHVIGNFQSDDPAVMQKITTVAQANVHLRTVPDWVQRKLKDKTHTLWWIHPEHAELLQLEERLVEFLCSRAGTALDGKLMRINCPQALARWQLDHDRMAQRARDGWQSHHPDALECVLKTEEGGFYELLPTSHNLRAEMAYESQCMRHCLGQFEHSKSLRGGYGEHYAKECEAGKLRLFSYRVGEQPRVTISAHVDEDGRLRVEQIKGKQNAPPVEKYHMHLVAFLNHLSFYQVQKDASTDVLAMNIVNTPNGWLHARDVTDEADQLHIMKYAPELSSLMTLHSPLVQWLGVVHAPNAQYDLPSVKAAMATAASTPTPNQEGAHA